MAITQEQIDAAKAQMLAQLGVREVRSADSGIVYSSPDQQMATIRALEAQLQAAASGGSAFQWRGYRGIARQNY